MELTLNKIAAGLVGFAMVAGLATAFVVERAHAAEMSLSDMIELFIAMDVIPADKADEALAYVKKTAETTPAAPSLATAMSCSFTRNLTVGATGQDVMDLQKLLNAKGFTVSATGAGSPGMESSYFGPATKAAVAKMQTAFASEILAPLGLTTGTGYFGASTRTKANALCAVEVTPAPIVPGDDDDATSTDDGADDSDLEGGEASLDNLKRLGSPSNEEVGQGDEEVSIAGWSFDVEDADVELNRVTVRFEATAGATGYSVKPFEYFDEVKLMLGEDEIASLDTSSKSDWNDLAGNAYELKFTGLKEKISEDDTAKLYVAVTVASSLDTAEEDTTWNVWIADNGIRARDGAGIDQYLGDANLLSGADLERTFSTQSATENDKFKVSLASSNPSASIIKVDETSSTKDVTILAFNIKAEGNDMTLDGDFPVAVTLTAGNAFSSVLSDIKLEIDGTEYNDWTAVASTTLSASTSIVTFDLGDEDVVVEKDKTVLVKVIVDLNKLNGNYDAGDSISASLSSVNVDDIDVEGGDTLTDDEKSGAATGETHQLMARGIFAEIASITETKTAGDNNANDVGDYVFKLDVTAFEDNFYLASTSATVNYHIEKSGVTATVATSSASLTSTATKESTNYRIDDGSTKTLTFSVSLNPSAGEGSGYYRVVVDSIVYGTAALTPTGELHTVSPVEDFESDELNLNA
ncbi:MAG: peptidoglycan-binding protein [Candidatus Pacebacteria bacterium]|nr:peptidoglycan-binding protein [Candidatus Paceibacterota bacterium]